MMTLKIEINGKVIGIVTARRIKGTSYSKSINTYIINEDIENEIVKHKYGDGAVVLAKKMLPFMLNAERYERMDQIEIKKPQRSKISEA